MTARDVRVAGDPADVRAVVAVAARFVPGDERASWLSEIAGVANKRARPAPSPPRPGAGLVSWWIALVVGVCAAFAGATVLLPPRNEGNQDPGLAMAVAVPAVVVGAVVMAALAVLPLPAAVRRHRVAIACAVIAAVAAIAGAVFALVRVHILIDAAGVPAYALWWVAIGGVGVAAALLILRIARAEAPAESRAGPRPADAARDLLLSAERAASRITYDTDVRRTWITALETDAGVIDPKVRAQAERLGPFAYLAWAAYGGHADARQLEVLIRGADPFPRTT